MGAISGLLVGVGCPPTHLYPLAWVGFILLSYVFLSQKNWVAKDSALALASCAFLMNCVFFYWFIPAFHNRGALSWPASVMATFFLFVALSFLSFLFGYTYGRLRVYLPKNLWAQAAFLLFFFIVWDTYELRAFPYTPIQFSLDNTMFFSAVHFLRPLGVRFLLFGFSVSMAALYLRYRKANVQYLVIGSLLITLITWGSYYFIGYKAHAYLKGQYPNQQPVALIQDNFISMRARAQESGATIDREKHSTRLIEMTAAQLKNHQLDIQNGSKAEAWIFWAETAMPRLKPQTMGLPLLERFQGLADLQFIGYNERTSTDSYNSVAFIHKKTGYINSYHKNILFPIGEYIPGEKWFPHLREIFPRWGRFSAGTDVQLFVHPQADGPVFIPFICYESTFTHQVTKMIQVARQQFPDRALILVNPTSDVWFGKTTETIQHSMLARWQAVVNGLPMIRSNEFGYSEIIAPWGEALQKTELDQDVVLTGWLPVKNVTTRQ